MSALSWFGLSNVNTRCWSRREPAWEADEDEDGDVETISQTPMGVDNDERKNSNSSFTVELDQSEVNLGTFPVLHMEDDEITLEEPAKMESSKTESRRKRVSSIISELSLDSIKEVDEEALGLWDWRDGKVKRVGSAKLRPRTPPPPPKKTPPPRPERKERKSIGAIPPRPPPKRRSSRKYFNASASLPNMQLKSPSASFIYFRGCKSRSMSLSSLVEAKGDSK
mmetsp:Transcript_14927/g.20916  ORF Transcript_14927/g.20916 Transcript_14927/m.20916 type:complete len:224 (+) Transcript_14927:149-820(+)